MFWCGRVGGLRLKGSNRKYKHPKLWKAGIKAKFDDNNRWMKGKDSVKELMRYCAEQGVEQVTLDAIDLAVNLI